LAARAGLSLRGIADLERGVRTQPRKETVQLLAEALQLFPLNRLPWKLPPGSARLLCQPPRNGPALL
jgi:transcriptional regulator with XRE-family HTH domain